MKKNKIFTCVGFSFFIAGFMGCSSFGGFSVPGETEIIERNIVAEYMNIANAYEDLKKYDKALEYYQLALDSDKKNKIDNSVLYSMGRCYVLQKNWSSAKKIYSQLLLVDEDNTNLKISLAYIDAMSGNLEDACVQYKKLSEENPSDASLIKNYISVLMAADKLDEAENQLGILKEKFPTDSSIKSLQENIVKKRIGELTSDEKKN